MSAGAHPMTDPMKRLDEIRERLAVDHDLFGLSANMRQALADLSERDGRVRELAGVLSDQIDNIECPEGGLTGLNEVLAARDELSAALSPQPEEGGER